MTQPNQPRAFYGEHLASVYDNDPYHAQGRPPAPPPQPQPQYYTQQPAQPPYPTGPAQAVPHGWHRPQAAPSPPAPRRPSVPLHASSSSASSSNSSSFSTPPPPAQYAQFSAPSARTHAPPPPPGAGPPLLAAQRADSRPPPHDYFSGPPPAQHSAHIAAHNQPAQHYGYGQFGATSGGAPPAVPYLPPAQASNRDSLSELIGTYGDTSPGSQGSGYGRNDSPSGQSSQVGTLAGAAFLPYSQSAYSNPSSTHSSPSALHRSQSAAVPGSAPRSPPFTQAAAGYVHPPLPASASYSGYPSTEPYQQYATYPAPFAPQTYANRPEPPPPRRQPDSPSYGRSPSLGERQKRGESLWGAAPPADAFFVPDLDRKKSLVQQAVSEAAAGGWRSTLDSSIAGPSKVE